MPGAKATALRPSSATSVHCAGERGAVQVRRLNITEGFQNSDCFVPQCTRILSDVYVHIYIYIDLKKIYIYIFMYINYIMLDICIRISISMWSLVKACSKWSVVHKGMSYIPFRFHLCFGQGVQRLALRLYEQRWGSGVEFWFGSRFLPSKKLAGWRSRGFCFKPQGQPEYLLGLSDSGQRRRSTEPF